MDDMETPSKIKRVRSPNYTSLERETLLNVVLDYKQVIENKKTDAVSIQEKKDAWAKISDTFNTISPNAVFRPIDSLKKYYEHLKEDLRKRVGDTKKEVYKTGGGSAKIICSEDTDDLLLSIVNKKTIYGLKSVFDSDAGVGTTLVEDPVNQDMDEIEIVFEDHTKGVISSEKKDGALDIVSCSTSCSTITVNDEKAGNESGNNWKNIKATDLRTPKNKVLTENIQKVYGSQSAKGKGVSRRWPATVQTLTSSKLAAKYEVLVDKRLELAECYKREHALRIQMLEMDIALKKKTINCQILRHNELKYYRSRFRNKLLKI